MGNGNCYCVLFNYFSKEKLIERNIFDEAKKANENRIQNQISDNLTYNNIYTIQNGSTGPFFSQTNDISSFNKNIYINNINNINIKKDIFINNEINNFNNQNSFNFFLKNRNCQKNNYFPKQTKNMFLNIKQR